MLDLGQVDAGLAASKDILLFFDFVFVFEFRACPKKRTPRGEAPPIGARANPGVYPPLDLYGTPEKTGPAEHYHHLWVTVA